MAPLSPYFDLSFWPFLLLMLKRAFFFCTGQLSLDEVASDEMQILVLSAVAVSAASVGSFLVLRKMTMLVNAISHTILLGIVSAYLLCGSGDFHFEEGLGIQVMLLAALITGLATTFLTEFFHRVFQVAEDASIGLVFNAFFALGVIMVTLFSRNAHLGAEVVMGNVDILQGEDLRLVGWVLLMNGLLFVLLFKEYKITAFDTAFAKAIGIPATVYSYLLMTQASATVVAGFRAVGVLMILAFLTAPPLMARLFTHDLKKMIALASLLGVGASVAGVALSRHLLTVYFLPLSTGGVVVCVLVGLFLITIAGVSLGRLGKVFARG